MSQCPIHGNSGPPESDDPFNAIVTAMVTGYLFARDLDPRKVGAEAVVSVHAEHDDDLDIFCLKIGVGDAAHAVMSAEHVAGHEHGHSAHDLTDDADGGA